VRNINIIRSQDNEVQGQIEKMVLHGIIEQEDADMFVQQRS